MEEKQTHPLINPTGTRGRDTSHLFFQFFSPSVVPAALFVECLVRQPPYNRAPGDFPLINR